MPFAAALSTDTLTSRALTEVCSRAAGQLAGPYDLALLFFSPHHGPAAETLVTSLREQLGPRCLLGCVGESIIGNEREIEGQAALSLWLARWPAGVASTPFHLTLERTPEGLSLMGWPDVLLGADPKESAILLLGDPYTFPADIFLEQVNEDSPGLRVLGGMASGIRGPGQCQLLQDNTVHTQGAVGVVLQGPLGLRSIVSQGCRPIGRHMVITRAEDDIILELSGRPPLEVLRELWPTLTAREQELFQQGLHIGRVLNEYREEFQRGDFLVRNVLGLDRSTGALRLTDHVRVGQTVQFHVRDAETADEDLHALLQMDLNAHDKRPSGALLFSCNGRGSRLFGRPDHDAGVVRGEAGAIPLAGFFAQGELGPVGGKNCIHGFTASVALFEE